LYGYLNGCGALETRKECARNIELQWLYAIIPNYHSISDFRKQNPSGLKKLVQTLVSFKDADLIGCEIIVGHKKQSAQQQESELQSKEN
jgi:hypothetical protein